MIAIDYKRKNIIVREFCLSIAYSVAGVLVLRNSHNHNIRGQYIWKNNKKKRKGKNKIKNCGRFNISLTETRSGRDRALPI